MGEFVLLLLRAEAQLIDMVDDLAQVVAALDLVFDLAKDLADLVLDGVRPAGLLLETMQVWKELEIDELGEIRACLGNVVIKLSILTLGCGPVFPPVRFIEDEAVALPLQPSVRASRLITSS
jgi:hypothetical protein